MTELNLSELTEYVLSPFHIFWKQKTGKEICVCRKGNFLNYHLLKKLSDSNEELFSTEAINSSIKEEFLHCFEQHNSELLVKNKIRWRHRLYSLFAKDLGSPTFSQFDLSLLAWRVFSKISHERAKALAEIDIDLFKRAMSIATSQTLGAFMLGYYNEHFLCGLFEKTFLAFIEIEFIEPVHLVKSRLERLRTQEEWSDEDIHFLIRSYNLEVKKELLLAERSDGSGPHRIHASEMTDLEKLIIILNDFYDFKDDQGASFFYQIQASRIKGDHKLIAQFLRCLSIGKEVSLEGDLSA